MTIVTLDPAGTPRGTVVALHGFTRSPRDLQGPAQAFAGLGARVLLPHLRAWWWPESTNNTRFLTRVADAIADLRSTGPVVIVGHSAGAPAGAWIASRLVNRGLPVSEVVLVDGVESPARTLRRAWPSLARVRVTAICGPPSRCNRQGSLGAWLAQAPHAAQPPVVIERLDRMGHGDIEGAGIGVYVRMCRDDAGAPARPRLMALLMEAVERGLGAVAN